MRALLILAALAAAAPAAAQAPRTGKDLFREHCALCHNERGHASNLMKKRLGEPKSQLEVREGNPPQFIAFVVRHGLGSMPPLRRAELDDAELKILTDYLAQPPAARKGIDK